MDVFTKTKRSEVMSRIRAKNTKPELLVRSLLHSMGYRFRLHAKDLPGKPDIFIKKYKAAIFVHGCFWHNHANCCRLPKSNKAYWHAKIFANAERDKKHKRSLQKTGWKVLTIWECEIKNTEKLEKTLLKFMRSVQLKS